MSTDHVKLKEYTRMFCIQWHVFFWKKKFDTKLHKMFLKRCAINGLDRKELFVGNTIIFSRHLLIKDYPNEYTKDQLENVKRTKS